MAPGRAKLATRPVATGSLIANMTTGTGGVTFCAARTEAMVLTRITRAGLGELARQSRKSFVVSGRKARFKGEVLAIDQANFAQSLFDGADLNSAIG
jgi:hypothetical protein